MHKQGTTPTPVELIDEFDKVLSRIRDEVSK